MSLPSGFLDEIRARVSLSQVIGRKLSWDQRKSNAAKGDYWACCPFHQEKASSFHVDDRKGFYSCFGCHAKGDAISFLKEAENMSFMEAVEALARDAGLTMPKRDPREAERADRRAGLAEVMEMAAGFYRLQLRAAKGQEARDYIQRRKLSDAAQERFEIGYAPGSRTALLDHLTGKGVAPKQMDEAGLVIVPEDGGKPYDRFRHRVIFPIRDPRGRCIAFGGRALSADARAKYLNSPETALFDKGRTLFNHGPARSAAAKTGALVVAEGYMDVIALVEAGMEHAVAPLGTAITEDQLRLMWRIADEPVIALDGDRAGLKAAERVIDLALPLLEPGRSLRFALMPE
ncbi:MAG: DNA primase, partial [Pikeienuella sp.]